MNKAKIKKEIIKEYARCSQDAVYFMKKYCKIQHPIRGTIPFELYDFQSKSLTEIVENRFNIILKSRQLGISTLVAGYSLWLILFHNDKNVLVIATKQDVAKNLVSKVKFMYQNLPKFIRIKEPLEETKLTLRLHTNSQIKATASTPDTGRSEALSLLIIDEAAFIKESIINEIWKSVQSTITTGGRAILLSTPNGTGNFFHREWVKGLEGKFWHNIFLSWQVHPERDQKWRDEQTLALGEDGAAQECDGSFIASGNTIIHGRVLQYYEETHQRLPIEMQCDDALWIFTPPTENHRYILCADVARGDGADKSAFHILDLESLEQCAEYEEKIDTREYAKVLVEYATMYNNALLVVENNNIGWDVVQEIVKLKYNNIYYMTKSIHTNPNVYNQVKESQKVVGFTLTSKSRPLAINKLLQLVGRDKSPIIYSSRMIQQLKVFVNIGGKPQAISGYNDDLVMSYIMGLFVRDEVLQTGIGYSQDTAKLLSTMAKINNKQNKTSNYGSRGSRTGRINKNRRLYNDVNNWIL